MKKKTAVEGLKHRINHIIYTYCIDGHIFVTLNETSVHWEPMLQFLMEFNQILPFK